ncbi:MAG: HAMP domain-containing sensor histidine kinase [Bryobacteraceae bacterium]|nr:HAMP domain-containing sensor histidine kinase [Bryobacteraceae bacterium]
MASLRHRLIAWHASVFAVGLLGFSCVIWIGARQILDSEIQRWLSTQAEGLDRFLHQELRGTDDAAVLEEAREFSTGLPRGSGVQLFSAHGRLLLSRPLVSINESPTDGGSIVRVEGRHARVISQATTIEGRDYRFRLWRTYEEADATLWQLARLLATLIPVFLVLSIAGGWWLSRRTLQPVDDLTSAARAVSLSSLSSRLPLPSARDELRRLCEAWNEMLSRLEASALRLKQFTADASHELRTPIAVIRTTADLALRQEREPAAYRDALERIREQSLEMSDLVENLLSLARSEGEQIRSSFVIVDLAVIAREVQQVVETRAGTQRLKFGVSTPNLPVPVLGDAASLRRLLLILIDNALKFTPSPGRVDVRVNPRDDGSVVIEVADTGIGINPNDLPKIFDRFFQADSSRSVPGSGLGLSLARWIAASHSATIDVESTLGVGSCFRVTFPSLDGERIFSRSPDVTIWQREQPDVAEHE